MTKAVFELIEATDQLPSPEHASGVWVNEARRVAPGWTFTVT
jgi:hypothetical protein